MEVLKQTTEDLYQMNEQPIVFADTVYPTHSMVLTKRVIKQYKDYSTTELSFTVTQCDKEAK